MKILIAGEGNSSAGRCAEELARRGHQVTVFFPADKGNAWEEFWEPSGGTGALDLLILTAPAKTPDPALDPADYYTQEVTFFRDVVETMKPHLEKGKRRIALLTTLRSSIRCHEGADLVPQEMVQAALNMMMKLYFNQLRPEGYTFRVFAEGEQGGLTAADYFLEDLCYDPKEPYIHSDENRLVMRDGMLNEIPW